MSLLDKLKFWGKNDNSNKYQYVTKFPIESENYAVSYLKEFETIVFEVDNGYLIGKSETPLKMKWIVERISEDGSEKEKAFTVFNDTEKANVTINNQFGVRIG